MQQEDAIECLQEENVFTYHAAVPEAAGIDGCREIEAPLIVMPGVLPMHKTFRGLSDLGTCTDMKQRPVSQCNTMISLHCTDDHRANTAEAQSTK